MTHNPHQPTDTPLVTTPDEGKPIPHVRITSIRATLPTRFNLRHWAHRLVQPGDLPGTTGGGP